MVGPKSVRPTRFHFHIRWSTSTVLDWQAFQGREEAEACAKDLVGPDETFTIEMCDENCTRCNWGVAAQAQINHAPSGTQPVGDDVL